MLADNSNIPVVLQGKEIIFAGPNRKNSLGRTKQYQLISVTVAANWWHWVYIKVGGRGWRGRKISAFRLQGPQFYPGPAKIWTDCVTFFPA